MNYYYILPRKRWYAQQRTIRRAAAALILAGGILLGSSAIGHDTARAVEGEEPVKLGYLIIPAKLREEKPVHDKRMVTKAPARVEIVEEESPSQSAAPTALHSGREGSPLGDAPASAPSGASQETAAEVVRTYLGSFKITGYDICVSCCGSTKGITASGTTATVGRTCAAPKDLPFGTRLWIEGIGERIVEDRGGAVHGKKLDILCADHPACYAITGTYEVYIIEVQK